MSTVLIYTSPARGHLYPMMDVAIAMREAGHRVVVQTLADEADRVTAHDLEHRPIAAAIEALELSDYQATNPVASFKIAFDTWLARAPHEVADLRNTTDEVRPDVLVVDMNTWGGLAFAERRGSSWASFMPFCLPIASPDAPAFGPGFAPPAGWLGRLRDRFVRGAFGFAMRGELARLNAFRADVGAPALGAYEDLLLRADAMLYRTAEPFEYPRRDWHPSVRAIGPGLWAPSGDAPDWIDDLPHPRVLVSVSTELQRDGAIIEAALEALADEPGSIVVTTAALDPEEFTPPHDRCRITRFLPHAAVIPKMDVVVTHGGMGTTQRSLAAGVPVCVVPWGRDQNESARRADVCGAGTFVPRSKLTPARLREAIREARARKPGAERVARAFREAGGAQRAVAVLEELLDEPESRSAVA